MILPDVNVLIFAFRQEAPNHRLCNTWLTRAIASGGAYALSPLALAALVRITTNRRTYLQPSTLAEAFAFCDYIRSQPNCQIVEPGERHWDIFRSLCIETRTSGPMTTDAWYAALAIEWGCEWITLDRDYARFPGLRWRMPQA